MFKNILMPIDLQHVESSNKAVQVAAEMAQRQSARLTVMTVIPDYGMSVVGSYFPEGYEAEMTAKVTKDLAAFCAAELPQGLDLHQIVVHGTAYEEILRVAGELGIDLVVMAAHRPELKDYLIGPNSSKVVRHADCSVFVIRD